MILDIRYAINNNNRVRIKYSPNINLHLVFTNKSKIFLKYILYVNGFHYGNNKIPSR